jgi:hypothetical protein
LTNQGGHGRAGGAKPLKFGCFGSREQTAAAEHWMGSAERRQLFGEDQKLMIDLRPIEPVDGVVLAAGVVVSLLGAAELITAKQKGHAERQKHGGEHDPALPEAQGNDVRIPTRPFDPTVPRPVVIRAAPVVLPSTLLCLWL